LKKIHQYILLFFIIASCDGTYVTKNVLDSKIYSFNHAGKTEKILIELKEIRTFTRSNGIVHLRRNNGPVRRSTTYDYAFFVSVSDGEKSVEIFALSCDKKASLDDFISKIKIKRSKNRQHFALAYENETIGVWHSMKKVSFLAEYPLQNGGFSFTDFNNLNFNNLSKPRKDLLSHISGDRSLIISDKKIHDILIQLNPNDEIINELSFSIGNSTILKNQEYQKAVIKHCKKNPHWGSKALKSIKNKKNDMSTEQFLSKLHAIGGMEEIVKEDEYQLNLLFANNNYSYFSERLNSTKLPIKSSIRNKMRERFEEKLKKPCSMENSEYRSINELLDFCEKLGIKEPFDIFYENYEKGNCFSNSLGDLTNEFFFSSDKLGSMDKRKWIALVVKNFHTIRDFDKSFTYRRIESDLSCDQKRELLTKYKKGIDTFNNMEIPDCN
jgi:hypothetical protein